MENSSLCRQRIVLKNRMDARTQRVILLSIKKKTRSFKSSCIVIHVHRSFSTLRKVNRVTQVNVRPWCAQEVILINKIAAG